MAKIRVGIGGWDFAPWRGAFYPSDLPKKGELAYASRHLTSIEINATFYRAQTPPTYRRWYDETPEDFVFSLKGPQFATRRSVLAESAPTIERFLASGIVELREKLGPILWQFALIRARDHFTWMVYERRAVPPVGKMISIAAESVPR